MHLILEVISSDLNIDQKNLVNGELSSFEKEIKISGFRIFLFSIQYNF